MASLTFGIEELGFRNAGKAFGRAGKVKNHALSSIPPPQI